MLQESVGFKPTKSETKTEITYITYTPSYSTFFTSSRCLVGLALNTQVHDMISADSTVINDDI